MNRSRNRIYPCTIYYYIIFKRFTKYATYITYISQNRRDFSRLHVSVSAPFPHLSATDFTLTSKMDLILVKECLTPKNAMLLYVGKLKTPPGERQNEHRSHPCLRRCHHAVSRSGLVPEQHRFASVKGNTAMTTFAKVERAIRLARKHVGNGAVMESSARHCLAQAVEQYDTGSIDAALMWARKSLAYSVGVFHADYKTAA